MYVDYPHKYNCDVCNVLVYTFSAWNSFFTGCDIAITIITSDCTASDATIKSAILLVGKATMMMRIVVVLMIILIW